jgi:hypothetical protein
MAHSCHDIAKVILEAVIVQAHLESSTTVDGPRLKIPRAGPCGLAQTLFLTEYWSRPKTDHWAEVTVKSLGLDLVRRHRQHSHGPGTTDGGGAFKGHMNFVFRCALFHVSATGKDPPISKTMTLN